MFVVAEGVGFIFWESWEAMTQAFGSRYGRAATVRETRALAQGKWQKDPCEDERPIPRRIQSTQAKTLEGTTKRLQLRPLRYFYLFWLTMWCALWPLKASAQVPFTDMNNAPAPVVNSHYSLVREPVDRHTQWVRARIESLHRPLVVTVASTDPVGRSSALVKGSVLLDVAMGTTLARDFDVGVSLGGHVVSWGSGEALVTGADGDQVGIGARDTRLEAGYSWRWRAVRLRPFTTVTLPTGQERNFAGRKTPSGELGWVADWNHGAFSAATEFSLLLFPAQPAGALPWGHQLRWGAGTRVHLVPDAYLSLETLLQPVVGALSEDSLRPFPAEVGLGAGWQSGQIRVQAAGGLGLALSRLPDEVTRSGGTALAPGTPAVRISLQVSWAWSPPQ